MTAAAGTMPAPELRLAIRTITTGGFVLDRVDRKPGYALIFAMRVDEFGAMHKYCFALADGSLFGAEQVEAVRIAARQHISQLVFVGEATADEPTLSWERFLGIFGGPVFGTSPLEPEFADQLKELSRNRLPSGLQGKPDDLFEAYVRVALEFILGTRVIRYGQERLFESRPDGIILPHNAFSALYDAKAADDGYAIELESIRQFGSYVRDFQKRYQTFLPRLNTFIVISGAFKQGRNAMEERNRDFQAEHGVSLSFFTVPSICEIIMEVAKHPRARRSLNWSRVFADPLVSPDRVQAEIRAIVKDMVVPPPPVGH
jgi:hypothetical protein